MTRTSQFFLIEFIGVTLVNKTILVSSVQLNNASPAYCITYSLPEVTFFPVPIYLAFAHLYVSPFPFLSGYHHNVVHIYLSSASKHPSPLTAVSLFHVCFCFSFLLLLLLNYFVDYIPDIEEITWYLSFFDGLISLSIMISRSVHAVGKGKIFFFFYSQVVFHCVNVPPLFYLFIYCFQVLAIINNAALNIRVQVFF